jgi:hypothetical protein
MPFNSLRNASNAPAISLYDWLIDSGATYNMTPFRQNFIIYTIIDIAVRVVNRETISAERYRAIFIKLK